MRQAVSKYRPFFSTSLGWFMMNRMGSGLSHDTSDTTASPKSRRSWRMRFGSRSISEQKSETADSSGSVPIEAAGLNAIPADTKEGSSDQLPLTIEDVFEWLRWSPSSTSQVGQALLRHFPGALPASALLSRTDAVLRHYDPSLTPENVLHGQSLCPDEINHHKDGLASLMADHWGEVFPMGGIGGAPYVGVTGFGAFSHHVPENGSLLILFGPHIGISESGELGKYLRVGQSSHSTACGALLAAYDACKAGAVNPDEFNMADMQQSWLRHRIHSCYDEIASAEEPISMLIQKSFQHVKQIMLKIVNHNFGEGKLILLGGIQINMPRPYADQFQPLLFTVSSKSNPEPVDLLPQLFESPGDMKKGIYFMGQQGRMA